ncbi:MAG: Stp1/IreP family PP2C-type Ser/Thr phosphatase [Clostridiales bacterium]|jgi:protein phosphatase|nr:Stp1/IreP family PP2C-type Ser/Thr phosphatase [Clostridiales bacterium]
MNAFGKSHEGMLRENNEDTVFVSNEPLGPLPNAYIVSDGMGGHSSGEIASQKSVAFFCEYARSHSAEPEDLLDYMVAAARYANTQVFELSLTDPALNGMGATFTACTAAGGKLIIAHIGDSRIYHIVNGTIRQITTDHSYVSELIRSGQITASQARTHPQKNVLTKALGVEASVEVDGALYDTGGQGLALLCSDGLSNMLTEDQILRIVRGKNSMSEKTDLLVAEANRRGGLDNISVILLDMTR